MKYLLFFILIGCNNTAATNTGRLIYRNYNGKIQSIRYYKNGNLHREGDLPAYVTYHLNGKLKSEMWNINGGEHREGDKPCIIGYNNDGIKDHEVYRTDNKMMRNGGKPSIIFFHTNGLPKEEFYFTDNKYIAHKVARIRYDSFGFVSHTFCFNRDEDYYWNMRENKTITEDDFKEC